MLYCEKCGSAITEGAKFCVKCGEPVKAPTSIPASAGYGDCHSVEELELLLRNAGDGNGISYNKSGGWDSFSNEGKIGWVLLWIFFFPIMGIIYLVTSRRCSLKNLSPIDMRRVGIIENYTFADDTDTSVKALRFIKGQLDKIGTLKSDAYASYWAKLWTSKADTIYSGSYAETGTNDTIGKLYGEIKSVAAKITGAANRQYTAKLVAIIMVILCVPSATRLIPSGESRAEAEITGSEVKTVLDTITSDDTDTTLDFGLNEDDVVTAIETWPDTNTIKSEDINLVGLMNECFEVSDKDAVCKLRKKDKYIEITYELVCKKDFGTAIESQLADKGLEAKAADLYYGSFQVNGEILTDISNWGLEGTQGTTMFNSLLKAQPGDTVAVKVFCEVDTYSNYALKRYQDLMNGESLVLGIRVDYDKNDGSYQTVYVN